MVTNRNYPVGCGICLGVFHFLSGIATCACGISSVVMATAYFHIGFGIWAGLLFYLVTGILAFASSSRNNCVITAQYVWAFFSVFVAMGQMGLYAWVAFTEIVPCWANIDANCIVKELTLLPQTRYHGLVLAITIACMGFIEWILAMVSCCISCTCCCLGSDPPTGQTIVMYSSQQTSVGQRTGNIAALQPPYNGQTTPSAPPVLQDEQSLEGHGSKSPILTDVDYVDRSSTHVNQAFSQETSLPHTTHK